LAAYVDLVIPDECRVGWRILSLPDPSGATIRTSPVSPRPVKLPVMSATSPAFNRTSSQPIE
jgi:hypothetical protein